jgi:phage head maturation protease
MTDMAETVPEPQEGSQRPTGPLEYRQATQIGVDFQERIIELIVMPYDERALVQHQGRMISESVAPGAFDGIERRPGRVKANRDHDVTRSVGWVRSFHPNRDEGLVAEVQISGGSGKPPFPLGDETLTLAGDGVLDVSAGFLPMPGGESWPNRDERRLTKLWLGHVAFTSEPAFSGAKVLSVRSDNEVPGATPNADEVRAWMLAEEYARLTSSR